MYGGAAVGHSASCSGTVAYNFFWEGPGGAEPASVILTIQGTATFQGTSGNCDDGLGDGENVNTNNGLESGTSVGQHYMIVKNPGQYFFLKFTPSANEVESPATGQCAVWMSMYATDVVVNFGGVLASGGQYANEALPGQYLTATLSAGQFGLHALNWALGTAAAVVSYSNHDANHTYQNWVGFTAQDLATNPLSFLPLSTPGPDPTQLTASTPAEAYTPYGIDIGQVAGSGAAMIRNPHGVLTLAAVGTSTLLPDNVAGTPKILSSGLGNTNYLTVGATMMFNSTSPSDFSPEQGYPGSVGYAQLLQFWWDEDGNLKSIPDVELDTVFPYSSGASNYPGTYETSDAPQIGYGSEYLSATDVFTSFTVYLPPGPASTWIPTTGGAWNWSSDAGYANPIWDGPFGNPAVTSQNVPWPYSTFVWTKTFKVQ